MIVERCLEKVMSGQDITLEEAKGLAQVEDKEQLYAAANKLREKFSGNNFDLCSIINAKSGKCSENCKYCAQSSHYKVNVEEYDFLDEEEVLALAKENEKAGVHKYSMVTSGRAISDKNLDKACSIYKKIKEETSLRCCASMGFLTKEKAEKLKESGVEHYHCNLETARNFFPEICTTHTYDEKVETIKIAQEAGMEVCSGGIMGLGETMDHRLEMAFELKNLGVKSIPINILNPIEGTPLSGNAVLETEEVLTIIALYRFINPEAYIRFAGGRILLGKDQNKALRVGINAALVGNYLTTVGNNIEEDLKMIKKEGFEY